MGTELRLTFEKADGGYAARLHHPDAGTSDGVPYKPFLDEEDYEDLRWYLEDYLDLPDGGSEVRAQRVERSMDGWGRRLYDAVFEHGDHRELLNQLVAAETPRLLSVAIGPTETDLLRLPWELMADSAGPLTRQDITVRRQLTTARRSKSGPTGDGIHLPLRILLVVSRPESAGFLDPRPTTRGMLDALDALGSDVVVDFCRPPELATLDEALSVAKRDGRSYHIVHFDGHGTFLPDIGLGALLFEKPSPDGTGIGAEVDYVRADRLGQLLARYDIPLAMLEACRTGQIGDVSAFRSVAPRLIEAGVASVVSMSHAVHIEATRVLLERFYRELACGLTVGQALEAGRGAMLAQPFRWLERGPEARSIMLRDWFLPNLYQLGLDPILVPERGEMAEPERPRRAPAEGEETGAFPKPPMYRFHGRARELHALEQGFREFRAIVLHAMGGMGKRALAREAAFWWGRTGLFPDGACFLSFERGGSADRIVQVLGTYLEGTSFESRGQDEQYERARELFQQKQVLMVWDNFESVLPQFAGGSEDQGAGDVGAEEQPGDEEAQQTTVPNPQPALSSFAPEERDRIVELFRDWTQSEDGNGRLLITCRPGETGLSGARRFELQGLARPDSFSLLARVLKTHGVELTDERLSKDNLAALLDVLADHPLSVELVGPHVAAMTPEDIVRDFDALLEEFRRGAGEERNDSLLASLAFSTRRLSDPAQVALPWLGLFSGGVFEDNLLDVSELDPAVWGAVRTELEGTALVRVEREILMADRPYLRFHPTLAYAARLAGPVQHPDDARKRLVAVYGAVCQSATKALHGSSPRGGMEVLAREEANVRAAVHLAFEMDEVRVASVMAGALTDYLDRSARMRERDAWVSWLAAETDRGELTQESAVHERQQAWTVLTQGRMTEAVALLEALIVRLEQSDAFDPKFQLVTTRQILGRVYCEAGRASEAIPILEATRAEWDGLVEREDEAGRSSDDERSNLAANLGDLANALGHAGRLEEALHANEEGIAISRDLGDNRGVATGRGRTAAILMEQGRHAEADARYEETLSAARRAGDRELETSLLQHQGSLADDMHRFERATDLYKRALALFQQANDEGSIMRTCNLLGVVERKQGRLPEARAWYERSREIARKRGEKQSMGIAAQNIGIVCQLEGEAAREAGDEAVPQRHFREAESSLQESLRLKIEVGNKPFEATAWGQLTQVYLLLGDLDKAEEHAGHSLAIREGLALKEVHLDYNIMAKIARAAAMSPKPPSGSASATRPATSSADGRAETALSQASFCAPSSPWPRTAPALGSTTMPRCPPRLSRLSRRLSSSPRPWTPSRPSSVPWPLAKPPRCRPACRRNWWSPCQS